MSDGRTVVFSFEDFEVDEALQELRRGGSPVELHATPLRLLLHLLRSRDRVVSKQELLDHVWPGVSVAEGSLATALKEVRRALGDDGSQQRVVQTLRGRGYRLLPPVAERPALAPVPVSADFMGRSAVLARMGVALEAALAGHGGAALLAGEAGIGKSRTAEEFAAAAAGRAIPVYVARCREDRGAPPYWPWVQIVRGVAEGMAAEELRGQLGSGAEHVARIVPELRERLAGVAEAPGRIEPDEARFRLFDALSSFLRRVALERGAVLIVDDLHWADAPSLRLLEHLASEIPAARLLLIGTYRDEEVDAGHPLTPALAELVRQCGASLAVLRPLEVGEVRALVARLAGSRLNEPGVEAVIRRAEGNPFFLRELVAQVLEQRESPLGIPAGVSEVIQGRLARLPASCREPLDLAAAMGRDFPLGLLERASGLQRPRLDEALEAGRRLGLVDEVGEGLWRFRHALTQEAVYRARTAAERSMLHRRIGEALEQLAEGDPESSLGELARHFGATADPDRAYRYAAHAGHQAMDCLAFEEAANHFEHALDALGRTERPGPTERCDLLLALGSARYHEGAFELYRQTFLEAGRLAHRLGDAERLSRAAIERVRVQSHGRPDPEGVALLEQALDAVDPARTSLCAQLQAELAWVLHGGARAGAALDEAKVMAEALHDPRLRARVACVRSFVGLGGPPEEQVAVCDEALRLAEIAEDPRTAATTRMHRIPALLRLGELGEADAEVARLAEQAHWTRIARPLLAQYDVLKALLFGRFDEAEGLIGRARALTERMGGPIDEEIFVQALLLRREQGRLSELEPVLRERVGQQPEQPGYRGALVLALADLGRPREARCQLEGLQVGGLRDLPLMGQPLVLAILAEACATLDDRGMAATLYELLEPHACHHVIFGNMGASLGSAARYLGGLAGVLERWEEAEAHFERALAAHLRLGARPWVARTRHDFARMLRARGLTADRERAVALAAEALEDARELGMASLADRADALGHELRDVILLRRRARGSMR